MTEPVVEKPDIPPEYGNPKERLEWSDVERRLESATVYWIASIRPDGRPHVIPRDGMWLDGALYYGGSPETVHYRNIAQNSHVAVHIGDGQEAIIVEGAVEIEKPTEAMAERLSDESFAKYPQYGRLERPSTWEACRSYGRAGSSPGRASPRTPRASGSSSEPQRQMPQSTSSAYRHTSIQIVRAAHTQEIPLIAARALYRHLVTEYNGGIA